MMPEPFDKVDREVDTEEDFASLLEGSHATPEPGELVMGKVVAIGRDTVTIDIGYKCEGMVPLVEFKSFSQKIPPRKLSSVCCVETKVSLAKWISHAGL